MATKSKSDSSWASNFGNNWIIAFSMVFPLVITISIVSDKYLYNVGWAYLIIACGTFPAMILFLLERPYPFTGDMVFSRRVNTLGEEDRKVLTFWKKSNCIRNVIFKTEGSLIALLSFMLLVTTFFKSLPNTFDMQAFAIACGLAILYFMFSVFIFMFALARFLLNNVDKIKKMDIEPWPIDKPYTPGPLWLKYRSEEKEKTSIFTEVLQLDSKMPFSWSDFGALIFGFISIILVWAGFETTFKSFSVIGIIKVVSGFILFQIALRLWRIKHKK